MDQKKKNKGAGPERESQGERGPEERFCFKKRKEEGFIKPYEMKKKIV
jgi:hypothetical protein